jgi:hypothetical protein
LTGRHYFLENLPGVLILFDHFSSEKEITGAQTDLFAINVFFRFLGLVRSNLSFSIQAALLKLSLAATTAL